MIRIEFVPVTDSNDLRALTENISATEKWFFYRVRGP